MPSRLGPVPSTNPPAELVPRFTHIRDSQNGLRALGFRMRARTEGVCSVLNKTQFYQ